MARPLKVANTYDLQQMTDTEIDNKIVPLILQEYAAQGTDTDFRSVLRTQNDALGPQGAWVDKLRLDNVGDHPVDPNNFSTNNTSLYVNTATMSVASVPPILRWVDANVAQAMTTSQITTNILDRTITAFKVTGTHCVGTYYYGTAAPSDGGTWTVRNTSTDRYKASGSTVTTVTYNLYQKTGATPDTSSYSRPVKYAKTSAIQEFTDAEIKTLHLHFSNLLISSDGTYGNVGEYQMVTGGSAPGSGTWTQVGGTTDTISNTISEAYSSDYTGTYSQGYTGQYSQGYEGYYSSPYSQGYEGTYSSALAWYSAGYLRSGGFTGTYSSPYSQGYTGYYSTGYERYYGGGTLGVQRDYYSQGYTGYYSSTFSSGYTGTYSSALAYYSAGYLRSGGFTGQYSSTFSQGYTGQYSQGYEGYYSAGYTGVYSQGYDGITVQSTQDTVTYTFWKRLV